MKSNRKDYNLTRRETIKFLFLGLGLLIMESCGKAKLINLSPDGISSNLTTPSPSSASIPQEETTLNSTLPLVSHTTESPPLSTAPISTPPIVSSPTPTSSTAPTTQTNHITTQATLTSPQTTTKPSLTYSQTAKSATPSLEPFARQTSIEIVTSNASSVSNPWGGHQARIVQTKEGIFTAYLVQGQIDTARIWQLARRGLGGTWAVIAQGETGTNPVDLLASPDGTLHVVGCPKGILTIWSGKPENGKLTMTPQVIPVVVPKDFQGGYGLRYSSGTNAQGDIVILFSFGGKGSGGIFSCAYNNASHPQWGNRTYATDYMYTYTYLFPGPAGQVSFTATRDVNWSELGYTQPAGAFGQVLNAFRYWRTADIDSGSFDVLSYAEELPTMQYPEPFCNAQTDAYLDTKDRMHILYYKKGATTGGNGQCRHRIVSPSGVTLFDEVLPSSAGSLCRIFQDRLERFYLLGQKGILYPMDAEGKSFGIPINLDLGGHQVEYSGYALSAPRTGTPLNDGIEIVFPSDNGKGWIYFHLDFSPRQQ